MKPLGKKENQFVRDIEKKETTFEPKNIWQRAWQEMAWRNNEERRKRLQLPREKIIYGLQLMTEAVTGLLQYSDTRNYASTLSENTSKIGGLYLELKEL